MNGTTAIFYRDYRARLTNIWFVFWDLFAPLAYLTLFGIGFEAMMGDRLTVEGRSVSYTAFLQPGVLSMVTFAIGMNTSGGFFMDKESGIFYEMLTYPITRTQIMLGKIAFNVVLALLGSLLVIALGALAMDVPVRWELLPLQLFVIVLSTCAWFFMFSIFANMLDRMDAFNTVSSAAYILQMFFSSMFYPLDAVPSWFRVVSWANPMTWQVDLLRFATLGVGPRVPLLLGGAGLVAFTAVCLVFAARGLHRDG